MKSDWSADDWLKYLKENLEFPFEVERTDDEDEYTFFEKSTKNEPFRLGHVFKAVAIDDFDRSCGLTFKCREGRRVGYVPLVDLTLVNEKHKNTIILDEFSDWFEENYR